MMEKLFLFLSILSFTKSNPVIRESAISQLTRDHLCPNLLNFNGVYYLPDTIVNVTGIPADMNVHWKTGNIFFTLISEEMKMNLQVLHPTGELEAIKVAGLGQSTSVDNLNDVIYLATDNGVYKYRDDGTVEIYTALGEDVMYIAVTSDGKTMLIATWPQNRVHKITNEGQKMEMFTAIPNGHGLTLDSNDNIYFVATKTSYILKNGYNVPIKINGLPSDKITGVFVSHSNEIYAMDENSNLYLVDAENASAKLLGSFKITGVNSFALDSENNVLIGIKGAILKFKVYEQNPCTKNQRNYGANKHKKNRKLKKLARTTTSTTPMTTTIDDTDDVDDDEEEER